MLMTLGTDENQECCAVATRNAKYYYQLEAGGFSSICDADGVDWVDFHPGEPTVPGGAACVFRGLPNLVHPEGLGHPGFSGCTSKNRMGASSITIETRSNDDRWAWDVRFLEEYGKLSITKAPDVPYWFLYEGTIGGVYDPGKSYWGFPSGRVKPADVPPAKLASSNPFAGYDWVYFGHRNSPRVFFCARLDKGTEESVLYFMGSDERKLSAADGMVVFGFGRGQGVTKQLTGTREFVFGFVETTDHKQAAAQIDTHVEHARAGEE